MPESNLPTVTQEELFSAGALPSGHELLTIEEDSRNHRFTGEIVAKNRERYQAIVRCLAEGIGIRATARAFRVSPHTIFAIRDREAAAVATEKKDLSQLMGRFVRSGVERLLEEVDDIPLGQLSVSVGIISDKKALLDGDPTVRVEERVELALSPTDLRAMLESMKRAKSPDNKAIDVEASREPVSDMQSDGSKPA